MIFHMGKINSALSTLKRSQPTFYVVFSIKNLERILQFVYHKLSRIKNAGFWGKTGWAQCCGLWTHFSHILNKPRLYIYSEILRMEFFWYNTVQILKLESICSAVTCKEILISCRFWQAYLNKHLFTDITFFFFKYAMIRSLVLMFF